MNRQKLIILLMIIKCKDINISFLDEKYNLDDTAIYELNLLYIKSQLIIDHILKITNDDE